MAQPFDPNKLEFTGEPIRVEPNIGSHGFFGPSGYGAFYVSSNGILAHSPLVPLSTHLVWCDRKGNELEHLTSSDEYSNPRYQKIRKE